MFLTYFNEYFHILFRSKQRIHIIVSTSGKARLDRVEFSFDQEFEESIPTLCIRLVKVIGVLKSEVKICLAVQMKIIDNLAHH